jgi:alpha-L-fucosidase
VLDWYDLRYPIRNDGTKTIDPKGDMVKFVQYMKDQLKELITNYDPYMLWFDGNWEQPWTKEMGTDVYSFIKKL